jgi:hypothetical protein
MFVSAQKIIILTFTVIEILATTIECCIVDGREAPTLSCACHGYFLLVCCIVFSNIFIIYVAFPLILLNKILNTSCLKYYGINSNNFKRKTAWLPFI